MHRIHRSPWLLAVLLVWPIAAAALTVDHPEPDLLLGADSDYALSAPSGLPDGSWRRSHAHSVNAGIDASSLWLRTRFELTAAALSGGERRWFYSLGTGSLDEVEFFHFIDDQLVARERAGTLVPTSLHPVGHWELSFPVLVRPGEHEIRVRITSGSGIAVEPALRAPVGWFRHVSLAQLAMGAALGILLAVALYNLAAFTLIRERSFLLFAMTLVAAICWRAADIGFVWQYLLGEATRLHPVIARGAGTLTVGGVVLITLEQLRLWQWSRGWTLLLCGLLVLMTLLLATPLFDRLPGLALFALLATPVMCCVVSVLALQRRLPGSSLQLLSNLCFTMLPLLLFLRGWGQVPLNTFTYHLPDFALVALGVLTSLALARRLNDEKAERLAAQGEAQSRGRFLANMSHEIRTPLNAVVGFAELLSQTPLEGEQRTYVDRIKLSSGNLLGVINDVLDYAKIEAGKLRLDYKPLQLAKVASEALLLFEENAGAKGLKTRLELDASVPDWVLGDAMRLSQILNNLLSNAIKFTDSGSVVVRIRSHKIYRYQGLETADIELAVVDSGIGLTHEQQSRLFQPFEQASADTARQFGGTGLGLSICAELVELMGGRIQVTSEAGQGSTFTVRLPMTLADVQPAADAQQPSQRLDLASVRLLLVEDNATNALLAKTTLRKFGAEVLVANHGEEALSVLMQKPVDAVLMDCQMPVMDGFDATRAIRTRLGLGQLPIIAMTANALSGDRERCLEAGMNDYIAKPFQTEQVLDVLGRWLPGQGTASSPAQGGAQSSASAAASSSSSAS